jgi:hypothetical protein
VGTTRTILWLPLTAAAVLATGCGGDPVLRTGAPTVPSPLTAPEVAVCRDAPFLGTHGPNASPSDASAVGTVAQAHTDLFAGAWWDAATQEFVFATVDASQATAVLATELPVTTRRRIEVVPRSDAQLAAIQDRVEQLRADGIQAGSARRVWDALVEIDLPVLDEASLAAVATLFASDLDAICVTGADPATLPPEGPQQPAGDGWRLLADQAQRGAPYSAHVALNPAEYESLWASLALDGAPPQVDFATEVVLHFGAVYSGSCPEIRLDGVRFDTERSLVSPEIVQLGGARACTSDANPRAYLVAVPKDRLPAQPFTVTAEPDCGVCEDAVVADLVGDLDPVAQLGEFDRWQILGAAAARRVLGDNSFGGQAPFAAVEVVDVLGRADPDDGSVRFDADAISLTEAERNAIVDALSPLPVVFVAAGQPLPDDAHAPSRPRLTMAQPAVSDGAVTVTTGLFCGSLCGTGGAHSFDRTAEGMWVVTGAVGPQWIS